MAGHKPLTLADERQNFLLSAKVEKPARQSCAESHTWGGRGVGGTADK